MVLKKTVSPAVCDFIVSLPSEDSAALPSTSLPTLKPLTHPIMLKIAPSERRDWRFILIGIEFSRCLNLERALNFVVPCRMRLCKPCTTTFSYQVGNLVASLRNI